MSTLRPYRCHVDVAGLGSLEVNAYDADHAALEVLYTYGLDAWSVEDLMLYPDEEDA